MRAQWYECHLEAAHKATSRSEAGFSSKHGLDDMTLLSKVTEDAIVENLQKRYTGDVIYVRLLTVIADALPRKRPTSVTC